MHAADVLFRTLQLESAPDEPARQWSGVAPDGLAALLAWEQAESWTLRRLTETGSAASAPAALVDHLKSRVRQEAARNLLVDAEKARVVDRLASARLPFVLMKGSARRALHGRFPCIDARYTTDVDVLLPEDAAATAWTAMSADGYRPVSEERPHHLAPLIGAGRVAVELHTSTSHTLDPAEAWRRTEATAATVEWSGRKVRVPGVTEMLWHALSHALRAELLVTWKLRALHEAAPLLAGSEPIDWDVISARLASGELPDERLARTYLGTAAQLAGRPLPEGIAGGAPAFDAAIMLRWRLEVFNKHEDSGYGARLLEEGTRAELGLDPADVVPDTGLIKQTRRRLGSRAARLIYRRWRERLARARTI